MGTFNVNELFGMLQSNCTKNYGSTFSIPNIGCFFLLRNWVLLFVNENAKSSDESILMLYFLDTSGAS